MTTKRRGSRDGSIYQRASDGRWLGVVTISKPGQPRKRKSVVRETRAEVREALKQLQATVDKGIVPPKDNITTGAYLARWLDTVPDLRPRTHVRYRQLLEQHIIPALGSVPLLALTQDDVRELLVKLRAKPTRAGRPLSAQTICHARSAFRKALSDAVARHLISGNPA